MHVFRVWATLPKKVEVQVGGGHNIIGRELHSLGKMRAGRFEASHPLRCHSPGVQGACVNGTELDGISILLKWNMQLLH